VKLYDLPSATLTDKSYRHGYLRYYDRLLSDLDPSKVLEVGIHWGASLALWREFWPDAEVHGIDMHIEPAVDVDRMVIHLGDAYTDEMVDSLPGPFDFILDDGPHTIESQEFFVANYVHLLAPGGVLVVEDLDAGHGAYGQLAAALPEEFLPCCYGVDLNAAAPDQKWQNHMLFVVDTRWMK
jgi:hypothetical protein